MNATSICPVRMKIGLFCADAIAILKRKTDLMDEKKCLITAELAKAKTTLETEKKKKKNYGREPLNYKRSELYILNECRSDAGILRILSR